MLTTWLLELLLEDDRVEVELTLPVLDDLFSIELLEILDVPAAAASL